MKLLHVVGARPNYMKVAALMRAAARVPSLSQVLVHTGQHYDAAMSDVFFADLGLPAPDHHLGVGAGSQATQTAKVMLAFEPVLEAERPDRVVVVGDVNSTLAAALVAVKEGVPVDHVEAGLRSFDRAMPEEVNRVLTDQLADALYTHSHEADEQLLREGRPPAAIRRVGNVMIDALEQHLPAARARDALEALGLPPRGYAVLTLHRPANVDAPAALAALIAMVAEVTRELPVVFPVHPRTRARLDTMGPPMPSGLLLTPPQGYLDFLQLLDGARLVITDSGGVQEETTVLGVPCLTLRDTTERPITCALGTNRLVGRDVGKLRAALCEILADRWPRGVRPPLWDGRAAERIAAFWAGGG